MFLCDDSITVFNVRLDQNKGYDVYTPTIIKGVSWHCEIASNVDSNGLKAANKFTIRIPVDADFSGKQYVLPVEYLNNADPESVFTLAQGDLIVHAEESSALTPAQLHDKYGEVVRILGVTANNRGRTKAPHWKVVGS